MSRRLALIIPMPVSPVERLAATYRKYLHLPDPGPLYVLMGAVAANMMAGSPVWLMMVGPPSCGKTELLNTLLGLPHVVEGADIAGEQAFLSGTSKKETSADATGGILRQVGEHGALVLNDFTSVLSKSPEKMASIMAVLRECFGGRWTRHIGVEGGRALTWTGKLAVFAGCTGKIDQQHQLNAELGERWVYYRFAEREVFTDVMMALSNTRNGFREDLREAVLEFFTGLGLRFDKPIPRRDFTDAERVRLYELALFASRCRSAVARDSYSKEIIAGRESEIATRMSTVLGQLLLGMDLIGVGEKQCWRLLSQVAMDSMPRLRKAIVEAATVSEPTLEELHKLLGCSQTVIRRVVEDLELQGILYRKEDRVTPTVWTAQRFKQFCRVSD